MTRSLCPKSMLGYLIFGLLDFIAIATPSSEMTRGYLIQSKADALYDEANVIALPCNTMYQERRLDPEEVSTQIRVLSHYLRVEIWVVNRQGTVVMDGLGGSRVQSSINGFSSVSIGNRFYTIGDYYGMFSGNMLSVSAPTTGNYNTYGYVLIHLPISEINQSQNGTLSILYIISAALFGLSLTILLAFTQTAYLPPHKIIVGADEYAAGNLDYRIDVKTHNEMGYLSDTLNYMSGELNKMKECQKNLIANVSHDFRSSLTPIEGYPEVILDGTIPTEMHEKYLSRVTSEAERLHKLIESMFILNSLDARSYLSRTNLDVNRVIKDMAAFSEGIRESKNVSFDFIFSDDIQMVFADLGKIQQVMYNLVNNAIKFSRHDSIIHIQAPGRYEKIFVSVKDTGIDILKGNLKKIWGRLYKTDLSRSKDKKGIGLGLSIVKGIIQAHGESIDVVSMEDVGIKFILSLPHSTSLQETPITPDFRSLWECFPVYKCFIIS